MSTNFPRFRWVELQLQYLYGLNTVPLLRKRLGSLPPELSGIYKDLYNAKQQALEPDEFGIVERILSWLLIGQRQLHVDELLRLAQAECTVDTTLWLCFDFVSLNSTQNQLRNTGASRKVMQG